jgi:hypothetical protein
MPKSIRAKETSQIAMCGLSLLYGNCGLHTVTVFVLHLVPERWKAENPERTCPGRQQSPGRDGYKFVKLRSEVGTGGRRLAPVVAQ